MPDPRHECDMSATLVKNFDFDNNTGENIFLHSIVAICQMKYYKERKHCTLRTTFWKWLVPMPE